MIEIGTLSALILAGTQFLLSYFPKLNVRIAVLIVTVLFGAVAFYLPGGLSVIEIILALLIQIGTYDFVVEPIIKFMKKNETN
jgi:hypothetical protein